MTSDEDFRVRPGRIRSKGSSARHRTFLAQVLHASRRAGGGTGGNPGKGKSSSPRSGPSTFGRGHSRFGKSRLFDAHRRVTVKARVVRQNGRGARPGSLADHLAYLRRDGVTRDDERAHLLGPDGQEVDAGVFAARCKDDRHHFRFIISPEDAPEMADFDGFTRDLVQNAAHRAFLTGRAQTLERMGLAMPEGPGRWSLVPDMADTLREMGAHGDIIKTMHRAMTGRDHDRAISPNDYVISGRDQPVALTGRLLERGLHNELTGEAYAVIDATDGHVHHVRFPSVDAFRDAPRDGGIVEVRTVTGRTSGREYLVLSARSDLDLAAQVKAPGATWLDHRLVERQPMDLARNGFEAEVRQAMRERTRHLADRGLASFQQDGSVHYQRNLLPTLRQKELDQVGAKLAKESGLTYERSIPGHFVTGQYVKRLSLSSGRFAMIDNGMGFQLVPWAPSLEKQHDRYVDGVARDDGGVDWQHDRKRDLGISM